MVLKFSGKMLNRYTKFRDDHPIPSRVILGKPEGVHQAPPPVPARVKTGILPLTELNAFCLSKLHFVYF